MVRSHVIARLGVVATAVCLSGFVAIIAIGSSHFSAYDLRSHGSALLGQQSPLPAALANTLAVTPHR